MSWFRVFLACAFLSVAMPALSEDPYTPDWESLYKYNEAPEWFRDAKFGIYFHWGVYCVPAFGSEWYPRNMHIKKNREYKHHVETYGDPVEYGYDKFVPKFTAEKFDADAWADLFAKAGARFAGPVAEHHDGFSMWASKLTPWNAKDRGPKRDLAGELAEAIRARGMKFVTSFHHARNSLWKMDNGKWTGHYDGVIRDFPAALEDPERAFMYGYMPREEFLDMWLGKLKEVIDNYHPDLMWFDSWLDEIPEQYKLEYLAYYFNKSHEAGKDVVVTFKQDDLPREVALDDYEKGRANRLTEFTWLTDDTISRGSWCYTENLRIKPLSEVLHVLIDIVSKNGQLLLNISPMADGTIPQNQQNVLLGIGDWLAVNGDAIYGTRPWVIFGEGPTRMKKGGHFVRSMNYTAKDIRFTTKGDTLYAIFLGQPSGEMTIACLGVNTGICGGKASRVSLLGREGDLEATQDEDGLHVTFPETLPSQNAVAIKIEGLKIAGIKPQIDEQILGALWQTEAHRPLTKFSDAKAMLLAENAALHGARINTETKDNGKHNIGFWDNPDDFASWKVEFPEAGTYRVFGRFASPKEASFQLQVGDATLQAQSPATSGFDRFKTVMIGSIRVKEPGVHDVNITPIPEKWSAINCSFIEFRKRQ